MKPTFQTKFGLEGNCFAACVATILECDIAEIPVVLDANQNRALNEWLAIRGLFYLEVEPYALMRGSYEDVVCIFTVESETPEVRDAGFTHAVVGKWDRNGSPKLLHDPRPTSDQQRAIKPSAFGVFLRRDIALAETAA